MLIQLSSIISNRRVKQLALLFFIFSVSLLNTQMVNGQNWGYKLKPDLKDGKYGAIDMATGKLVIPHKYKFAMEINGNFMLVSDSIDRLNRNNFGYLWGLVNEKGELVLEKKYHRIYFSGKYFTLLEWPNAKLLDENFKLIYETEIRNYPHNVWGNQIFDILPEINRFIISKGLDDLHSTKFTLLDLKTKKIYAQKIGNSFSQLENYNEQEKKYTGKLPFFQIKTNSNWERKITQSEVIDINGKVLFDSIRSLYVRDNRIIMQRNDIYIIADSGFKVIDALSYKYDTYQPFRGSNNRWYDVRKNGNVGIIDPDGKFLFPLTKEWGFSYIGNNAFALSDRYFGSIRKIFFTNGRILDFGNNQYISPHNPKFPDSWFTWPVILRDNNYKYGLMDSLGKFVAPQEYNLLAYNTDQLIYFKEGKSGYLDRTGRVLITTEFDSLSPFFNDLAVGAKIKHIYRLPFSRKKDDKYNYTSISEKLTDTLYTYLDRNGNTFGNYDKVTIFQDSIAQVVKNRKRYIINRQGKIITFGDKKKYWLYSHFNENVAVITNRKQNKFGLVNRKGKIIAKPKYSWIGTEDHQYYTILNNFLEFKNSTADLSTITSPAIYESRVSATDPKLPQGARHVQIQITQ